MPESPYSSFYNELLNRLQPVAVVGQYVRLREGSRSYRGLCPFHDDTNDSFHIYLDDKHYHCFGCLEHGNLIDFVAKMRNLEYREAAKQLAQTVGLEVPTPRTRVLDQTQQQVHDILGRANSLYRQALKQNPEARRYLHDRGIEDDVIDRFSIGYAPDEWDFITNRLHNHKPDLLAKTGIIGRTKDGRLYDLFRGRVVFPIRDYNGHVHGFGGRILKEDSGDGKSPKYLNSPESPVFKKKEFLYGEHELNQVGFRHERLLLVEGYMDVVGLAQYGINYAQGVLGTAVNVNHLRQMFAHTQEVVVCFDGDEAGRKAAERTLEAALSQLTSGRILRFLFLPEGSDPDSQVQAVGKENFEKMIGESKTVVEFLQAYLLQGHDIKDLNSRIGFVDEAIRLLTKIPHEITRTILIDELTQMFPDTNIQNQLGRVLKNRYEEQRGNAPPSASMQVPPIDQDPYDDAAGGGAEDGIEEVKRVKLDISPVEKKMVAALLQSPEYCANLEEDLMSQWREVAGHSLLYELWSQIVRHQLDTPTAILASMQGSAVGDALYQIYDQTIAKNRVSVQGDNSKESLSNQVTALELKNAIATTISKNRKNRQLKSAFTDSDIYKQQRK